MNQQYKTIFLKIRKEKLTLRILSMEARYELKSKLMINNKILRDILRNLKNAMLISEDNGYYYT